jgi:hypothetical protein
MLHFKTNNIMKKLYLFLSATLLWQGTFCQCSVTVTGSTNATCNGNCNGSATLTTVGTPSFSYSWAPGGQTIQNPTNLCAGVHTVTMTDASACQATATVNITQPAVLTGTTTQVNVTCNGNCNGSINLTPTGGTTPYTYSWSPGGATTEDVSALCAGTYTVTITDANNCTSTVTATVTQPAVLNVAATTNTGCGSACDKSGIATPSGGTSPYTYLWSPGGQTTSTATGLCAGTFQVTVTDANGCTANGVVTISNPTVLSATVTCTNASCFGGNNGSAAATQTGGTPGYTYSWSPGGQTTANSTGLSAGTYTCTVTDANGCTATASCSVTQPGTAVSVTTASTGATCGTCPNGSTSATASGGVGPYTYSWSPGGCAASNCTGLIPGTYTVTVTDANGCTATQTVTVANTFGINELFDASDIHIFPNPVFSDLTFELDASGSLKITLTLTSILGEKVMSETFAVRNHFSKTFNVEKLPAGVYFLELQAGNRGFTHKIIKY